VIQPVAGEQVRADPQDLGEAGNWRSVDVVWWGWVRMSVCVFGGGGEWAHWVDGRVGALGGWDPI
jgi:hypothetical protein